MATVRSMALLPLLLGLLWPAAAWPQSGQLTIAQGTDAVTMDPHNTTQMTATVAAKLLKETLGKMILS